MVPFLHCVQPPEAGEPPRRWIKQELIAFPGFVCNECNHPYFDGMIECQCCTRHLAEVTDLSVIAEPARVRSLATREGRLPNMVYLQPSAGLTRQRVRHTGQDDEQVETVQSTASTVRAKIINQQKQAESNCSATPQDRMNIDPMQAHNFAKAGLSFYTIEALQRFANVRLPNRNGKGKGKGSSSYYDATGKLAFFGSSLSNIVASSPMMASTSDCITKYVSPSYWSSENSYWFDFTALMRTAISPIDHGSHSDTP